MIMFFKLFIPFLIFNYSTTNEEITELLIQLNYNKNKLTLNKSYKNNHVENFRINKLQFYISNLKFYYQKKEVLEYHKDYILVDLENESSLKISVPSKLLFDQIRFNLGIDEETNRSGAKGDDLDPVHGMYWTWNSGYINFKIEGLYDDDNEFLFHLGGFMKPYNTLQKIKINISNENRNKLVLNFDTFLNSLDFNINKILSPGKDAVKSSNLLAKSIN
ncbi:hypothetical protein N8376_03100 [Flavobacteriaceae bacterium]|nr:hypothetical protein [Flavobacteriaceae bacterium]